MNPNNRKNKPAWLIKHRTKVQALPTTTRRGHHILLATYSVPMETDHLGNLLLHTTVTTSSSKRICRFVHLPVIFVPVNERCHNLESATISSLNSKPTLVWCQCSCHKQSYNSGKAQRNGNASQHTIANWHNCKPFNQWRTYTLPCISIVWHPPVLLVYHAYLLYIYCRVLVLYAMGIPTKARPIHILTFNKRICQAILYGLT